MRSPLPRGPHARQTFHDRFGISGLDALSFGGGLLGGLYLLNDPVLLYSLIGASALGLVVFLKK